MKQLAVIASASGAGVIAGMGLVVFAMLFGGDTIVSF